MLNDMVVVLTGGAGYVGLSLAEGLVANGARVVIAEVNEQKANELVAKLNHGKLNSRACFIRMDITSEDEVKSSISQIEKNFGRIGGLVNAAYPMNKNYGSKLEDVTYASFCENVSLHLGGYFLTTKIYGQYFARQRAGVVVNFSSIYGVIPPRFEIYQGTNMTMPVEYAAIKSGIQHLTKYFAKYFKGSGVRFNILSPGGILGDQPELFVKQYNEKCLSKGMLDGSDLIGALVFLLSDGAQFVNGLNVIVDDGFSL